MFQDIYFSKKNKLIKHAIADMILFSFAGSRCLFHITLSKAVFIMLIQNVKK